ncbi:glycosyltransferase family A protein [Bordetella sp. 02P26C-1]|uniref:glycosyltransferase family A protein n=1 Tax=Bordetella sp. 02P26C-1 TaxID=2683195 RepID=UPI0013660205|nr:glycosyltransferase family A protein [Bordetella sp. 02P26C-1]
MESNHIIEYIKKNGEFDCEWYLQRYPDVLRLGVDPIYHYVHLGALLDRDPSPEFSTRVYLNTYPDVKKAGLNPYYHFLKYGQREGRRAQKSVEIVPRLEFPQEGLHTVSAAASEIQRPTSKFAVEELDRKLWGGYSRFSSSLLEETKRDEGVLSAERAEAAWFLARWYYFHEDNLRALENIQFYNIFHPEFEKKVLLLEVLVCIKLRRWDQAHARIDFGMRHMKVKTDLLLLKATLIRHEGLYRGEDLLQVQSAQLAVLNEMFSEGKLSGLQLKDPSQPLHFYNLASKRGNAAKATGGPKVSIVIPMFNARQTIALVLDSLLNQTWRNLEIIVVDDVSTDDSVRIVQEYQREHRRIKLIRQKRNGGAYAARNAGLRHATGDYITVHDSDDWSHPSKIELQVNALKRNATAHACISYWVRVTENLEVVGPWRAKSSLLDLNFSSLMFDRTVLQELGGWDVVRVNGDAEFRTRLLQRFGPDAICKTRYSQILSLALSRDDSLTRSKATAVRSLLFGMRWFHRDAYQYWHAKRVVWHNQSLLSGKREYPLARGMRVNRGDDVHYDFVVISDFALKGGAFVSTLNYIIAACKLGKKVAVVHWRKFDLNIHASVNPKLYDACLNYDVDILTPGDKVTSKFVLFGYPAIINNMLDDFPEIRTDEVIVIVNQFAERLYDGSDPQYDPLIVRANLRTLFGKEGIWIAISELVRGLMERDERYPKPYPGVWSPMIEAEEWTKGTLRWRGGYSAVPIIGRHGRDAYTKWPSNPDALRAAYLANKPWPVRMLGGASCASDVIGDLPPNWEVIPFGSIEADDFLQDLDFYIHYPHEKYIEEFGRAVMEAMAIGVAVVLPPVFRQTFGDAALYADAEDVGDVIEGLWRSEARYLEQVRRGRQFVVRYCDVRTFGERISQLESVRLQAATLTSAVESQAA